MRKLIAISSVMVLFALAVPAKTESMSDIQEQNAMEALLGSIRNMEFFLYSAEAQTAVERWDPAARTDFVQVRQQIGIVGNKLSTARLARFASAGSRTPLEAQQEGLSAAEEFCSSESADWWNTRISRVILGVEGMWGSEAGKIGKAHSDLQDACASIETKSGMQAEERVAAIKQVRAAKHASQRCRYDESLPMDQRIECEKLYIELDKLEDTLILEELSQKTLIRWGEALEKK
ncbi:hypothetical protein ACFL6Y_11215 [Elusimicrobiota bacterium]